MSLENEKCVIVMDEGLPLGLIANTAAIWGTGRNAHQGLRPAGHHPHEGSGRW